MLSFLVELVFAFRREGLFFWRSGFCFSKGRLVFLFDIGHFGGI